MTPTISPTQTPTNVAPTLTPTVSPTAPTESPTAPTNSPTPPTESPTAPTESPTAPTEFPTIAPTEAPTNAPTNAPTEAPSNAPTETPTNAPTEAPTNAPTVAPTNAPTVAPTTAPTVAPTNAPTLSPTAPTQSPTAPTESPTIAPKTPPTHSPTAPTKSPTAPTKSPTAPTKAPTCQPSSPPAPSSWKRTVDDGEWTPTAPSSGCQPPSSWKRSENEDEGNNEATKEQAIASLGNIFFKIYNDIENEEDVDLLGLISHLGKEIHDGIRTPSLFADESDVLKAAESVKDKIGGLIQTARHYQRFGLEALASKKFQSLVGDEIKKLEKLFEDNINDFSKFNEIKEQLSKYCSKYLSPDGLEKVKPIDLPSAATSPNRMTLADNTHNPYAKSLRAIDGAAHEHAGLASQKRIEGVSEAMGAWGNVWHYQHGLGGGQLPQIK
ncbi:MAG TPA: hypothetical protein VEK06_03050 [Myxococcota bacterium]|nr:hypothetical protein [Myxococcota bacterium]